MPSKKLFVIIGPTGVGKTEIGLKIAQKTGSPIISADSRQFFHEMSIGTAVPSKEEIADVPHFFLQNKSIHDYYNASIFELEVNNFLKEHYKTNSIAIMLGGSMMYIDALCFGIDDIPDPDMNIRQNLIDRAKNCDVDSLRFDLKRLDPEYYAVVDLKNTQRIIRALEVCFSTGKTFTSFRVNKKVNREYDIIRIGLNRDREQLFKIINSRVDKMIDFGLIEEARSLYEYRHLTPLKTVGYRELFDYFDGNCSLEFAIEKIKINTRNYAKRQISWFKRSDDIKWFNLTNQSYCEIEDFVLKSILND